MNTSRKTSSGRTDFNQIKISSASMYDAKSDFVSYIEADLSNVGFFRAKLSFCEFQGADLSEADLNQAVLIGSSFSNQTKMHATDVKDCLILLSTCDEEKSISREWLKRKGVVHSEQAITNNAELDEMLNDSKIDNSTAKHYMEKINSIYGLLNSMKIRKENSMFIDPNWLALLKYSTQENLDILKTAYVKLNSYTAEHKDTSESDWRYRYHR